MKRSALVRKTPMVRTAFKSEAKPAPGPKMKKCAYRPCRAPFLYDPKDARKVWCSDDCGAALALEKVAKMKAKAQRKERAEDKVKRDQLKTRADWMKDAQAALNKWIREVRDVGKPCVSCGRHHQGQLHAGHYLSRGSHPHLALVELNLALQCQPCNVHLSGNQLQFRFGLIDRIGLAAVEALEADNTPRKYTVDELQAIKVEYRRRVREASGS